MDLVCVNPNPLAGSHDVRREYEAWVAVLEICEKPPVQVRRRTSEIRDLHVLVRLAPDHEPVVKDALDNDIGLGRPGRRCWR